MLPLAWCLDGLRLYLGLSHHLPTKRRLPLLDGGFRKQSAKIVSGDRVALPIINLKLRQDILAIFHAGLEAVDPV